MAAIHGQTKFQLAPFAMTAVNVAKALGLADADVLSLTTGVGLQDAIAAKTVKGDRTRDRNLCVNDLVTTCLAGVPTDAQVAAADTIAGLRTAIQTYNTGLSLLHSAQHLNQ